MRVILFEGIAHDEIGVRWVGGKIMLHLWTKWFRLGPNPQFPKTTFFLGPVVWMRWDNAVQE